MNYLIQTLKDMIGSRFEVTPEALARLAFSLLPVLPDLADGDAHLSQESRLKIQEAVMSLRAEVNS